MTHAPIGLSSEPIRETIAVAVSAIVPETPFATWSFDPEYSMVLFCIIVLAGLGTTALFLISVVAFWRRRTTPYLLITFALGLLVVRTIVGFGTLSGRVPMPVHHFVEHSFDFFIAVVILYTIYTMGSTRANSSLSSDSDE